MGLLRLSRFSSIPDLFRKIQSRRLQKERFTPTFLEWAGRNFELVLESESASNGSTLLFLVPESLNLFITGAWISTRSTVEADVGISFGEDTSQNIILNLRADAVTSQNISLSYPMPIKVVSGVNVFITASGIGHTGTGGIIGFTTRKSDEIV